MKISQRLPLLFVVGSLVPLTGVGVLFYQASSKTIQQQVDRQLQSVAARQVNAVASINTKNQSILSEFASKIQLRLLLQEYADKPSPSLKAQIFDIEKAFLSENPTLLEVAVTDSAGRVIASTNSALDGAQMSGSAVYQAAQKGPSTTIFGGDSSLYNNEYVNLAKVLRIGNETYGYAFLKASTNAFVSVTQNYDLLGNTGETFFLRQETNTYQFLTNVRFNQQAALTTVAKTQGEALQQATKGQTFIFRDYRGRATEANVRVVPDTDWLVVVKIDSAEIFSALYQLRGLMIATLIIAAVGALGLAWWFSGLITRPLNAFIRVVNLVQSGNLKQRAAVKNHDEIGQLATAFNSMTDHLLESRARLVSSVMGLSQGFVMTNEASNITMINQRARQLLQLPEEGDLPSLDVTAAFGKIEDLDIDQHIKSCLSSQQPIPVKNVTSGGKYFNLYVSPVLNEGTALGCVILLDDVTEERILQRSKDEFFSIASHELRTPLTAIKGNSSMMLQFYADDLKNPDLKEMINDINTSSIRLIEIVNDFLDMSRLEQGKVVFKPQLFPIDKVIEQVLYEMGAILKQKNLYLATTDVIKSLGTLPQIYADPDRTKQILYNLVGNALKFTEKGGVTIDAAPDGTALKVRVTDTGRGMSPESQALLFHKFQQAGDSLLTRDTTRGTGLGLYISKLMVQGMGGRISLEKSVPGEGTTFSFTLPLTPEAAAAAGATDSMSPATTDANTGLTVQAHTPEPAKPVKGKAAASQKRIFIFEDDPYVQRLYQRIFSLSNYDIELASDSEHGLAQVKQSKPDLILLDIMMPKINGLTVLRDLRGDSVTKDVPVLALTNIGEADTIKQARALGVVGYLIKSDFTPEQLLKEVDKYLKQ